MSELFSEPISKVNARKLPKKKLAWRPLVDTYFHLKEKLGDFDQLPIRKRFCMAYLTWGYTGKRPDKFAFVELAIELRKEENKVGRERSKLERIARKLFKEYHKHKSLAPSREASSKFMTELMAKGGSRRTTDPEKKQRMKDNTAKTIEKRRKLGISHARSYIVVSPLGEKFLVHNLMKFCAELNLSETAMYKSAKYPDYTCYGWRAQLLPKDWKETGFPENELN